MNCCLFSDAVFLIWEQSGAFTNTACVGIQGLIRSAAAASTRIWQRADGQSVWGLQS